MAETAEEDQMETEIQGVVIQLMVRTSLKNRLVGMKIPNSLQDAS
jgi:hypothetical protein